MLLHTVFLFVITGNLQLILIIEHDCLYKLI